MTYGGELQKEQKPILRGDLHEVLGFSKTAAWRFWDEVSGKYLFADDNNALYMENEFFFRGKIKSGAKYQQIFIDSTKKLYELTPNRRKQYLGYAFQLVPFVNVQWNIVCRDVGETDLDKVDPITVDEFCRLIGYDVTSKHKLLNTYKNNIIFPVGDHMERLCSFVTDGGDIGSARIFVNPNILYHGTRYEQVRILGKFSVANN